MHDNNPFNQNYTPPPPPHKSSGNEEKEIKVHKLSYFSRLIILAIFAIPFVIALINGLGEAGGKIGFEVMDWIEDVLKHPFSRHSFESFCKLFFTTVFVWFVLELIKDEKK